MPAVSIKQRRLMAIAEHHPERLRGKNRGVLKMGKKRLHEFASTEEEGLPKVKRGRKGKSLGSLLKGIKY